MTYYPSRASAEKALPAPNGVWRRSRPGGDDLHTSLLFWMTVLGLACATLLGVAWGASAILAKKGSEKLLRVELSFPKLKSVHEARKVEPFRMSEDEISEPPPKERKAPAAAPVLPTVHDHPQPALPPAPLSAPWTNLIAPLEAAPVETCHDPLIYQQRCSSPPGDSPMIRNWKTLTMVSLLSAAAVTFVPQPAVLYAQDKKDPIEVKGLDDLQKSINALVERIDKLEKKKAPTIDQEELTKVIRDEIRAELKKAQDAVKADVAALQQGQLARKREIDALNDEIAGLRKKLAEASATPAVDKAFMEEFRSGIKTLNETIARLGPTKERISGAAPINGSKAAQGTLVIVNLYNEDLLFLVNTVPYRVPAGMSKVLEVPAGALHYRVHSNRWGPLSNQSTTLAAGETFTLTAANQR